MPGGGTWIAQNKQRPGAYINVVGVPATVGSIGSRGIITCALPMTWGPQDELITLLGTDLLDGKSIPKVGCTAFDTEESLPYRLALAKAYKALLFRADTGGSKAVGVITGTGVTEVKATALYNGTTGNKLTVVIVADTPVTGKSTVSILFSGKSKETFVVDTDTPADLVAISSAYVVFTCGASVAAVPATAGTALTTGTNGTVNESTYADYFDAVTPVQWQCMAIDSSTGTAPALIAAKIRSMRDSLGRKVQAVVYNSVSADYEGIISVKQGFKTAVDTIPVNLFPLYVASLTAGSQVNESNTGYVVPDATEITGYIPEDQVEDALAAGWFILSYRQDGKVCIEQDINCFTSFTATKGYTFCKNRVIRTLDEFANSSALIFNRNYLGKQSNNDLGRKLYKNEVIHLGNQLQGIEAFQNFVGVDDIEVLPGEAIDAVVLNAWVQPVDSMEKLYMTVNVGS